MTDGTIFTIKNQFFDKAWAEKAYAQKKAARKPYARKGGTAPGGLPPPPPPSASGASSSIPATRTRRKAETSIQDSLRSAEWLDGVPPPMRARFLSTD